MPNNQFKTPTLLFFLSALVFTVGALAEKTNSQESTADAWQTVGTVALVLLSVGGVGGVLTIAALCCLACTCLTLAAEPENQTRAERARIFRYHNISPNDLNHLTTADDNPLELNRTINEYNSELGDYGAI